MSGPKDGSGRYGTVAVVPSLSGKVVGVGGRLLAAAVAASGTRRGGAGRDLYLLHSPQINKNMLAPDIRLQFRINIHVPQRPRLPM